MEAPMDETRFDDVARRWGTRTRRGALGLLVGGLATLAAGDATEARHRKKCRNGTMKCHGRCISQETLCCPKGQEDSGGVCATPPTCNGANQPCSINTDCCSGACVTGASPFCAPSSSGNPCHDNGDCKHSAPCTGFICGG
jgi:hypothetical protein